MSHAAPRRSWMGGAAATSLTILAIVATTLASMSEPTLGSDVTIKQSAFPTGCLMVRSAVRLEGSPEALVTSTGTYDTQRAVGWFRHVLQGYGPSHDTLVTWARHAGGLIEFWPSGPNGSPVDLLRPPALVSTPEALVVGRADAEPELARVGRYQPGAAIELLRVADAESRHVGPHAKGSSVDVRLDLDAAGKSVDPGLRGAAAAFPVRALMAHVQSDPWDDRLRTLAIRIALPSGAGGVAQLVKWTVTALATSPSRCDDPPAIGLWLPIPAAPSADTFPLS